ncbi:Molybdopterin synthase sulfur carrier subunit [Penicillium alfredii]|uniref:Molybdopterin synthase sulfur carrier subunit n=1 Tax=Penicillium alfredii TaxID=1506179 RepID=A0A9W9K7Z3_9EURO|nr:Molybdopterin synthase sulfur carrier subunit [Penicillium alfredii]KAJ5096388.1 Molybdopterin synthase sulfur carrier subunit [Penicillium alfredii]
MASIPTPQETQQSGTFTIHYFASAAQYTTKDSERLPAPLPLARLFALLESRYPGIQEKVLCSCGVSVEGEYVDVGDDADARREIHVGEEVAVIPPVSSG